MSDVGYCSPPGKNNSDYLTAFHCVSREMCNIVSNIQLSDGTKVNVIKTPYMKHCSNILCRLLFEIGLNRLFPMCIEDEDLAWISAGNNIGPTKGVLFAGSLGSIYGSIAIFSGDLIVGKKYKVISRDFYIGKTIEWETTINGKGIFYVLYENGKGIWIRGYYSFPTQVRIKPGFSGSPVIEE
ncbi:hypothetical protein D1T48_gp28 [Thermoproteus tenax virus 1]|uniref:Uncharacterized 20.2 kDa protein n=1 Tax=Thermoproteus tenax virus 1 (strain KRA1) TaxID=10480 RepID=YORP_TTV1K|nr:hypothetical protein D1T48_gp28 [Thermoproteus tenax virus 1]P19300.1 RecName: Full=Uncharacterized 20.2 kDa protein [Thermoproteus tenax virus 1 (STRAIN KRA1)]CAA32996.1 unnamed protein product [Thermoproteus tenax virus 1]